MIFEPDFKCSFYPNTVLDYHDLFVKLWNKPQKVKIEDSHFHLQHLFEENKLQLFNVEILKYVTATKAK